MLRSHCEELTGSAPPGHRTSTQLISRQLHRPGRYRGRVAAGLPFRRCHPYMTENPAKRKSLGGGQGGGGENFLRAERSAAHAVISAWKPRCVAPACQVFPPLNVNTRDMGVAPLPHRAAPSDFTFHRHLRARRPAPAAAQPRRKRISSGTRRQAAV